MRELYKEHKEVMHYTSASGLHGIVTSKTLWASHTSFLNDTEEVDGFFNRVLPIILRPAFERHVAESEHLVERIQAERRLNIDLFDHLLRKIVDAFEKANKAQDHYVTSFCTPNNEWISQNGLLSQWRGYGLDGGYAIVFDHARLPAMLAAENDIYYEECLLLTDVQYDMAKLSEVKDEQVLGHMQKVQKGAYIFLSTGEINTEVEECFESNRVLSVLCKHRGFEEEKEVRIVVSEPSVEMGRDTSNESGKPYRKAHSYLRNGAAVPCIRLFEDQKSVTLPIVRVIVGPHPEKHQRRRAVEILLRKHGIDAEVVVSDTPYRGK